MRFPIVILASVLLWTTPALAGMIFGANTPTPVDYLAAHMTNSVNFRVGAYQAGYNPGGSWTGTQVPVITGPTGFWSTAVNYPNANGYTIQFHAPNPAAVGVTVGGMFNGLSNVQISGNTYSATFNLFHDGGNIKAGGGEIDLNTNAANPVTGFRVIAPGGLANPGGLTPDAAAVLNRFGGFRTMNQSNINFNNAAITAADLLPSGQNLQTFGTSLVDQVAMVNANPNAKQFVVNVPANADKSYTQGAANIVKGVKPGVTVLWELSNEPWNALFPTYSQLYNKSLTDAAHTFANNDSFGRSAEMYGIKSVEMMQWVQEVTPNARAFLSSQGANVWYDQQAINAINRNYPGQLHQYVGALGPSDYPSDNLDHNPGNVDGLITAVQADMARQHGYMADNATLAHTNGLNAVAYEVSIMGFLTKSGVSASLVDQFLADPRSGQLTTQMLTDLAAQFNRPGDAAFWFTEPGGDYWGGTPDPFAPHTEVQKAVLAFADAKNVPEPAGGCVVLAIGTYFILSRRRAA